MKKNIELTVSATVSKAIRTLLTNEELDWAKRNRIEKFIERRIIKEDGYIELIEINSKIYGKNILAVKDERYDDQDFDPGHYEYRYVYTYFLYINKEGKLKAKAFYTVRNYRDLYPAEVQRYPINEKSIFNIAEMELDLDHDQTIEEKEEIDYEFDDEYRKYLGCED